MRVHIAPTYRCNLDCAYCYAKKFAQDFPDELEMRTYLKVLHYLLPHDLTSVSFIGGEPTLWTHLTKAMTYAHQMGLKCLLYTNGFAVLSAPDTVILNMTRFVHEDLSLEILEKLAWYCTEDCVVVFRFNIARDDPEKRLAGLVALAKATKAGVSIAALDPFPHDLDYGKKLFGWWAGFFEASLKVSISRPVPLCMLTEYQRRFLELNGDLRGACDFDTAVPVINADGMTVFPCNSIPIALPLNYVHENRTEFDRIKTLSSCASRFMPKTCRGCGWHLEGKCSAGCMGTRIECGGLQGDYGRGQSTRFGLL